MALARAGRTNDAETGGFVASLTRFLGDFGRYAGGEALVAVALVAVAAVLESLGLVLLIPILAVVVDAGHAGGALGRLAQPLFAAVGAEAPLARLAVLLALFGALMLVRALAMTWRDVRLTRLQVGFLEHQRGRVADLLAGAQWHRLAGLRHARVTHLMGGDIQRVSAGANFLVQAAVSAAMLTAQCAVALVVAPQLAAAALVLLAAIGLALAPMVRRSQRLGGYVAGANLSLVDTATQFLGGLKLAMSQNLQGSFVAEFKQTLAALAERQIEAVRQRSLARLGINLLSAGVGAAILLIGFGWLREPAPVLIALLLIVTRMAGPVGQIQQGLQQLALALPAYDKLAELKAELADAAEPRPRSSEPFPEGPVVFERVTYRHRTETGALGGGVEALEFELAAGDFVGVAGPSGAGKTTFADLLVGLFAPQSGRITVGGRPLQAQTLAAWREGVAYASQDPFLFHDTVRRNLAWANPGASEAEMWAALELADAADVVRRMDGGLDAVVGERGGLVSGGERQRIAIARAVLRRPRLLVLDEAASAIDVAAEQALVGRLTGLAPAPTIVIIAHRPESLALCRRTVRLEGGRFVAPAAA